jgi:hypothetical protein
MHYKLHKINKYMCLLCVFYAMNAKQVFLYITFEVLRIASL